jgi:hypothetical protein
VSSEDGRDDEGSSKPKTMVGLTGAGGARLSREAGGGEGVLLGKSKVASVKLAVVIALVLASRPLPRRGEEG